MISPFLTLLLAAHAVGDFYLQNDTMAEKKDLRFFWLLFHGAVYMLVMAAAVIPIWSAPAILCAIAAGLGHFIIDFIKSRIHKARPQWAQDNTRWIFAADQLLHIAVLFTLCSLLIAPFGDPISALTGNIIIMSISGVTLIKAAALILLAGKPVNVAFIRLFSHFKPVETQEETNRKAGATIGFLERLIILVLFGIGQYAASGLILTAKSIVRYSKIAKDKEFGEYYLLGTLFSVLSAIALFLLIW